MKKITILALSIMPLGMAVADTSKPDVKGNIQITANTIGGCELDAENINFGVLMTPLSTQQTNAQVSVKCSKGQGYSLAFNYGTVSNGVLGQSEDKGVYTITYLGDGETSTGCGRDISSSSLQSGNMNYASTIQQNYNPDTDVLGDLWRISGNGTTINFCYVRGSLPPEAVNCNTDGVDSSTVCGSTRTQEGVVNGEGQSVAGGKMTGGLHGDTIGYEVKVPEGKNIWSVSDVYTGVGSGDFQVLPYTANINPMRSSGNFPAPDTYIDNSSIIVNF